MIAELAERLNEGDAAFGMALGVLLESELPDDNDTPLTVLDNLTPSEASIALAELAERLAIEQDRQTNGYAIAAEWRDRCQAAEAKLSDVIEQREKLRAERDKLNVANKYLRTELSEANRRADKLQQFRESVTSKMREHAGNMACPFVLQSESETKNDC